MCSFNSAINLWIVFTDGRIDHKVDFREDSYCNTLNQPSDPLPRLSSPGLFLPVFSFRRCTLLTVFVAFLRWRPSSPDVSPQLISSADDSEQELLRETSLTSVCGPHGEAEGHVKTKQHQRRGEQLPGLEHGPNTGSHGCVLPFLSSLPPSLSHPSPLLFFFLPSSHSVLNR